MRNLTSRVHGAARLAAVAGLVLAFAGCASEESGGGGGLPPTFTISGTVSGDVTANVTVKVVGTLWSATTDSLGGYTIRGIRNGSYTIEASLAGYNFVPATRLVTVDGAAVTGQDFTSKLGIAIAGKIGGDRRAGVTLTLTGPAPATTARTVTSDENGDFDFQSVDAGAYLVAPSLAGGWRFRPANILVTVGATAVTGADFVAIAPTHALSGTLTGAVVSGVSVSLSHADGQALVVTDGAGRFAFPALPPGDYVVTPSYPGHRFTPASRNATVGDADVTGQDFVSVATRKISGRVSGDVLAGVAVSLSGASTGSTTTDASGYFEFTGLLSGSYVLTASRGGYTVTPATRPVTLSGADVTNVTFTAEAAAEAPAFTVSGAISGASPSRVTVALEQAGVAIVATRTDAAGAFSLADVPPGDYLLVPDSDDFVFDPASRLVTVKAANVAGQAFTASVSPSTRTIDGRVSGAATTGVTVTLVGVSPATTPVTVKTDGLGEFAFRGLADGVYLATPSLAGYAFTPADCLVTVAGPSVSNVQFTSVQAPHGISGRVTGAVSAGVPVTLSAGGNAIRFAVTGGDGSFAFTGLANGDYVVTPSLDGYYFGPVEASVTLAGADVTGVAFVSRATHRITGFVSGAVMEGVQVSLAGAVTAVATTDATGFFAFEDLPDGGYVLTPALEGYLFDPKFLPLDLAGADVTTASFTATLIPTYTVSGTISGAVLEGVTVQLSGAASATTATDETGAYEFTGLPNGSYMVIPSRSGHTFTPASRAFRINDADVSAQDFASAVAP